MKQGVREELSAGGVVFRRRGGLIEFVIGKHSGYHKWVLPKGLVERGEGPVVAAVREVEEEVGVKARVVDLVPLATVEYWYWADWKEKQDNTRRVARYAEEGGGKMRVHKKVIFYLMELEEDLGKAGWEMEERSWVGGEEGRELLAFASEKEVWEKARQRLGASGQN